MMNNAADKQIKLLFRTARILCRRGISPAEILMSSPRPLSSNPSTLTLPYNSKNVASPVGDESVIFAKSYAQVATPVLPQGVIPESGELKLKKKRPSPLTLRLSENQKSIIRAKAKNAGVTVNHFILASALGSDYRPPREPELIKKLEAANLEMTRQGTNLNQIAFLRNSGKATDAEAESMLCIIGRSMLKTHQAIRNALTQGQEMPPEP